MRLALSVRLWLYGATGALFLTGAVWLFVHYFAPANTFTRLASLSMQLHGGAASAMLLLTGLTVGLHVPRTWGEGKNRVSGLSVCAMLIILVGTGYCLYYAGDDAMRAASSIVHWAVGLCVPMLLMWHVWRTPS